MKNKIPYFIFSTFLVYLLLAIPAQIKAQGNYEILKSALIIQFVQNVTWPNESQIKQFHIGVMGADTSTFNKLHQISLKSSIKGKKFTVRMIRNLKDINDLHVLYIDKTKSLDLLETSQAIEHKRILMITELSPDTKNIMMNILSDDKKKRLSFEVNKANLIIENLEMNAEVLLHGGTEIDIRELYREIKKQYENEKDNAEKQKAYIQAQVEEINQQKEKIRKNDSEINSLKDNIRQLSDEVVLKENDLKRLSTSISEQQEFMDKREQQLMNQRQLSQQQEIELLRQKKLIMARSNELDSLIKEGEKQKATISDQSHSLQSQEEIINLQKRVILIIIVFVFVFGILSFVIMRVYKSKQVLSSKLENSYATLREQHHSILELNKELNGINEMLEQKVHERTKVLEERNTQLTEYAFINSHLLRAPLSQIIGLSYLLTKGKLNTKEREIVENLTKSTEELDQIIRKISDLLYDGKDFSREEIEGIINRKFNVSDN